MGIVWEAYHKGVPLLRVPGITLDIKGFPGRVYLWSEMAELVYLHPVLVFDGMFFLANLWNRPLLGCPVGS